MLIHEVLLHIHTISLQHFLRTLDFSVKNNNNHILFILFIFALCCSCAVIKVFGNKIVKQITANKQLSQFNVS